MKKKKLLEKALAGTKNFHFKDLVSLVEAFGFRLARISGNHQLFVHPEVDQIVNLQNVKGKAKPYQVRQFLTLVEENDLEIGEDE